VASGASLHERSGAAALGLYGFFNGNAVSACLRARLQDRIMAMHFVLRVLRYLAHMTQGCRVGGGHGLVGGDLSSHQGQSGQTLARRSNIDAHQTEGCISIPVAGS
jgi:hypothetical protein